MGCNQSVGSFLGTNSTTKTVNPNWYDPLGPASMGKNGKPIYAPTGGIPLRNGIFDEIGNLAPTFQQNADTSANMLRAASANPGYAAAQKLATSQINGDYLNGSPELDNAMAQMRTASNAGAQDAASRARSQFQQNGMSFGTPQIQAQGNAAAEAESSANQAEAGARLQNYQAERGIQQSSPAMLDQSLSSPINYLAQIPSAYTAPLAQDAQLVQGLAGGGQIAQPDTMVRPGPMSEFLGSVGQL